MHFKNYLEHWEKGAWVKMQEVHMTLSSDCSPPPPQDAPYLYLGDLLTDSPLKARVNGSVSYRYKSMLEGIGFVDVEETLTRCLVGYRSNDEKEKLIGRMQQKNMENGLHGLSLGALTKHGGFTTEEADKLADEAKKDMAKNQADKRYYVAMCTEVCLVQFIIDGSLIEPKSMIIARNVVRYNILAKKAISLPYTTSLWSRLPKSRNAIS